jgi:hypothetical protein
MRNVETMDRHMGRGTSSKFLCPIYFCSSVGSLVCKDAYSKGGKGK